MPQGVLGDFQRVSRGFKGSAQCSKSMILRSKLIYFLFFFIGCIGLAGSTKFSVCSVASFGTF